MGVEVAVGCALVFGAILAGVWAFRHRERRAAEAHAKAATKWDAAGAEAVAIAADTPILRRSLVRANSGSGRSSTTGSSGRRSGGRLRRAPPLGGRTRARFDRTPPSPPADEDREHRRWRRPPRAPGPQAPSSPVTPFAPHGEYGEHDEEPRRRTPVAERRRRLPRRARPHGGAPETGGRLAGAAAIAARAKKKQKGRKNDGNSKHARQHAVVAGLRRQQQRSRMQKRAENIV